MHSEAHFECCYDGLFARFLGKCPTFKDCKEHRALFVLDQDFSQILKIDVSLQERNHSQKHPRLDFGTNVILQKNDLHKHLSESQGHPGNIIFWILLICLLSNYDFIWALFLLLEIDGGFDE